MPGRRRRPAIRFTPYTLAKLLYLRDCGETEVGGFGISAPDDLLRIVDFQLVTQRCTAVSVQFDDAAVADYFDQQADAGCSPETCGRIWIHTHPGHCPQPSGIDEATFARCFGRTHWAVMLIVARDGSTYARLQSHVGPQLRRRLDVDVDYAGPFPAADPASWQAEYDRAVTVLDAFAMDADELPQDEPELAAVSSAVVNSQRFSGRPLAEDTYPDWLDAFAAEAEAECAAGTSEVEGFWPADSADDWFDGKEVPVWNRRRLVSIG